MNEMVVQSRPMTSVGQELESVPVSLAKLCAHQSTKLRLLINEFTSFNSKYLKSSENQDPMDVGRTDSSKVIQVVQLCI